MGKKTSSSEQETRRTHGTFVCLSVHWCGTSMLLCFTALHNASSASADGPKGLATMLCSHQQGLDQRIHRKCCQVKDRKTSRMGNLEISIFEFKDNHNFVPCSNIHNIPLHLQELFPNAAALWGNAPISHASDFRGWFCSCMQKLLLLVAKQPQLYYRTCILAISSLNHYRLLKNTNFRMKTDMAKPEKHTLL